MHRIRSNAGINPDLLAGLIGSPVTSANVFLVFQLRFQEQPMDVVFDFFHVFLKKKTMILRKWLKFTELVKIMKNHENFNI